jgi:integrase
VTIVPRGSRYGVKVWDQGRRSYRWVGTFATEDEAIRVERDATLKPGREMPTISQWAKIWLSDYARASRSTQRTYRYASNRIVEELGARRLNDIGRVEARQLANQWPRGVTRVAATIWADAVRDGVTELNPFTNLRLERGEGRKDLDALAEQEVRGLAGLALVTHGDYGPEASAIILTLGFVGMRPGELCALQAADLDLANQEMAIRRTRDATGHEKLPKNGKERTVTVPPAAVEALRQMPASLDGYVFHSPRGRLLNKGSLHYVWRPILAAWRGQGGRDIDIYDLRHAAATHFIERGVMSSDVALQLGHTDGGRLVERLYGHPKQDPARDRLKMAYAEQSQGSRRKRGFAGGFGA